MPDAVHRGGRRLAAGAGICRLVAALCALEICGCGPTENLGPEKAPDPRWLRDGFGGPLHVLAEDDQQEWGTRSALDVSGALRIEDDMAGAGARRSGLVRQARKPGHGASPRAPCYRNGANLPSSSHPEVIRSSCPRSLLCECNIRVLMPGVFW